MLEPLTSNLERYMDLLSARQKLTASNIANADTPGFQTQDIDFQFEYATLTRGEQPQIIRPANLKTRPDGNNVDLDREARLLAENAIRFNVASTLLRDRIRMVQQAIQSGGGGA
jgi:flagellar basal-body rod protein FlgB